MLVSRPPVRLGTVYGEDIFFPCSDEMALNRSNFPEVQTIY